MLYVAVFWRLPGEWITRHEWAKIPSGPFSLSTQKNSLSVTGTIQAAAFHNKDTLSKTLSYMMDYFQPLQLLMMDLCLKLFDMTKDKILSCFVGPITHENFRGVLLEHYGALQSIDKASIPKDLYDHVSYEDIITTSVKTHQDSCTQTSFNRWLITRSARTSSQQQSGSLHTMSHRSMSKSLNHTLSDNSQPSTLYSPPSTSIADSSLSPTSTLGGPDAGSHGKRTSEQSGVSYFPIPTKCSHGSEGN